MTTYVLDGKASATLPRRPLAVRLGVAGQANSSARLAVRTADGQPTRVVQQSAGLLILPRVDVETTIVAVPDGGRTRFDAGTVLHVSFGPDSPHPGDASADVAQLTPRDVSGMGFIELATVAPGAADTIIVRTRLVVPDAALPPLAARARVACRSVLRTDQVDESQAVSVRCVVDSSASMAPRFAAGDVATGGELIAGVAAVIAQGAPVSVIAAGGPPVDVDSAALGEYLSTAPASGFGFGGDPAPATEPGARTLTVFVTDGPGTVPAELVGAGGAAGAVATLVLSASTTAARRAGFVGATLPPSALGADPRAALLADLDGLTAIVAALLAPTGLGSGPR